MPCGHHNMHMHMHTPHTLRIPHPAHPTPPRKPHPPLHRSRVLVEHKGVRAQRPAPGVRGREGGRRGEGRRGSEHGYEYTVTAGNRKAVGWGENRKRARQMACLVFLGEAHTRSYP